jgi:hypothetical protein
MPGSAPTALRDLSPGRERLLRMMQALNFGRIEALAVCDGEPVFDPRPRPVSKLKLGGENGPRPESRSADFAVKREVAELFEHLEHLGNGVVRCIEVKHGLPFIVEIEELIEA